MSGASLEKVKDRIRKLLNLASNDAAADGEIDNALRFAQKLMADHHLSEDDIGPDGECPEFDASIAEMKRQGVGVGRKVSFWERKLCNFVERFVGGVRVYLDQQLVYSRTHLGFVRLDNAKPMLGQTYYWYGPEEDVQLAAQLFDELRATIIAMARLKWGSVFRGDGASYAEGFVVGLWSKLEASEADTRAIAYSSGVRALAVMNARELIIKSKQTAADKFLEKTIGVKLQSRAVAGKARDGDQSWNDGVVDGKGSDVLAARSKKLGHR